MNSSTQNDLFLVVVNRAAHDGFVSPQKNSNKWSPRNQFGWTYQNVAGAHGHIEKECGTLEEAETYLAKCLKCDALETGRYCYTHNPTPQQR